MAMRNAFGGLHAERAYETRSKTISADTSEQMNREWEVRGSPLSDSQSGAI